MSSDRRRFIKAAAAGALSAAFPASIQRALALPPRRGSGTLNDVEHVVFLMQENRSFDHYFGTLRGVRGFGDPRAARLPSGEPVWNQPSGAGKLLPYRPEAPELGFQFMQGTPHNWPDAHAAWNSGKYDGWVAAKGTTTMAHLERADVPFHYALADAFTICDAYHCSVMGATDPNRYHMWTGWVGNDGNGGGPVLDNAEAGYDWHTYPERLVQAGISWKVYQDIGLGLDADNFWGWGPPYIGNYGDNSLLYFHQYQNAVPGSPLYVGARTGTDIKSSGTLFDQFKAEVAANQLPQVSWIVAPEAYSEHPNWPPNYGAWFVSEMLDALTANPDVWAKTVLFVMFDENDGLFDHVVPPTPPVSRAQGISTIPTTNELFPGNTKYAAGPVGLGARVPMIVVSPWSKGGWVNSEVFDHTSLIRFIERRFGKNRPELTESNITPWRRAVAGDLTSTLDFKTPSPGIVPLPNTSGYAPPDHDTHDDFVPTPPAIQAVPKQEHGVRPARALPYELDVAGKADPKGGTLELKFQNTGKAAAVFQVRGLGATGPWTYTVGARDHATDTWSYSNGETAYDLAVHGPNGFYRTFKGGVRGSNDANVTVNASYDSACGLTLELKNKGKKAKLQIYDAYGKQTLTQTLDADRSLVWHWPLDASYGWYDLTVHVDGDAKFERRLAGHVEDGRDSVPAIRRSARDSCPRTAVRWTALASANPADFWAARPVQCSQGMELKVFSPRELYAVLCALRNIAVDDDRFTPNERALIEGVARIHGAELTADDLYPNRSHTSPAS